MLYLTGSWGSPLIRNLLDDDPRFGVMDQPAIGNVVRPGWRRALDNGQFSRKTTVDQWWDWLRDQPRDALFVTAPDVVPHWAPTLERFHQWAPRIRGEGFKVALVLQDGIAGPDDVPWDLCDAVFTGGTTVFKVGDLARRVVRAAQSEGKWTHMGRVNSLHRCRIAQADGYDSVDGTFLAFGPDVNVPRLLRWMDALDAGTWSSLPWQDAS